MENVRLLSDEYFRTLNPIAKRICEDISSTRENYESAWDYLSCEEQNQVINESLIYPDAVLRYSSGDVGKKPSVESFPTLKISYGCKILQDDTGAEWRDEHSAPFSWKTSSQFLDVSCPAQPTSAKETNHAPKKKKPPVPPPKPPKPVVIQHVEENKVSGNVNEESGSPQQNSSEDDFSSLNSQVCCSVNKSK